MRQEFYARRSAPGSLCETLPNLMPKKRPPELPAVGSNPVASAALLRRNLARRIQRAGIVDFGDLVVAKAQHLAEDLVGVFTQ